MLGGYYFSFKTVILTSREVKAVAEEFNEFFFVSVGAKASEA